MAVVAVVVVAVAGRSTNSTATTTTSANRCDSQQTSAETSEPSAVGLGLAVFVEVLR